MPVNINEPIPKSTMALASVLWGVLALLGSVILVTVLSVRENQREYAANQVNNTRRIETLESKDIKQDDRIGALEVKVGK